MALSRGLVEASGSMQTRNRKKLDSCQDAEMTDKLSESDETYIPQENMSIADDNDMDDSSGSLYYDTGDICNFTHNEITVPTASNRGVPVAEILQRIPLFNISTMNSEWARIQNRVALLRICDRNFPNVIRSSHPFSPNQVHFRYQKPTN